MNDNNTGRDGILNVEKFSSEPGLKSIGYLMLIILCAMFRFLYGYITEILWSLSKIHSEIHPQYFGVNELLTDIL